MEGMRWALLLLGGDLDDPPAYLDRATELLDRALGHHPCSSRDHWTVPWGFHDHRLFLNRALLVRTRCAPQDLMLLALDIERELGRQRPAAGGYAPRTIDIDILLMEDLMVRSERLTLPHPRMHERAFALAPAADLCPEWVHPGLGRTVLDLLNDLHGR